jgi:hypothetical protein
VERDQARRGRGHEQAGWCSFARALFFGLGFGFCASDTSVRCIYPGFLCEMGSAQHEGDVFLVLGRFPLLTII